MIRSFDYDTISDVLIHISYTFKEDFALKNRNLNELEQNLLSYASSPGLFRLISLRHEFPTSLHRLLESISESEKSTEFETDKRYFPYFLAEKELDLTSVECFIQYKTDQLADNSDLDLKINSTDAGRWTVFGKNMKKSSVAITGNPSRRWTLEISGGTIDNETVEDIFLLLQYTAS